MEVRRADRETAESVLELPGSGSFPEQTGCGVLMRRMRYGSVAGTLGRRSHRTFARARLIPFGLLAAAGVIIFVPTMTRESSLSLCSYRKRRC
jgi:hypothetical protein